MIKSLIRMRSFHIFTAFLIHYFYYSKTKSEHQKWISNVFGFFALPPPPKKKAPSERTLKQLLDERELVSPPHSSNM